MIALSRTTAAHFEDKRNAGTPIAWMIAIVVALSLCAAPTAAFAQDAVAGPSADQSAATEAATGSIASASPSLQAQAAKAKTFKVVFKANKGSGKMAAQAIKRGKATKLSANKFKRTGYGFVGWNTKKNGKGKAYKNKQSVKNLAKAGKKAVLYAQWTNKYKVVFKANKGTGKMSAQTFTTGKAKELKAVTFTRKKYLFDSWNTKANGTGATYYNLNLLTDAAKPGKKLVLYAQWKKAPKLRFVNELTEDDKNLSIGSELWLNTNNPIAKVKLSDSRILVPRYGEQLGSCWYSLVAREVGKTTITITDAAGQTLKTTVRVSLYEGNTDLKSSKLNTSLKAPVVGSYSASRYTVGVFCKADFKDGDTSRGYQLYLSPSKNFDNYVLQATADSIWNGSGYAHLFASRGGYSIGLGEMYMKLRSYRIVGSVMEYGPWGKTKKIEIPNDSVKRSGKAQYSYELYNLTPYSVTSGTMVPVFIKTENPQPNTIQLLDGDTTAFSTTAMFGGGQYFDDIKYSNTYDASETLHRVKGGYVCYLKLETAGTRTLQLRESNKDGYVVAKKVKVKVGDYDTEFNAWVDDMIKKAGATGLNPKEKMDAVVSWIWQHEGFTYLANQNGYLVTLTSKQGPCYKTKTWDSYVSPAALCRIADHIGGFEEIHNCYGDYAYGTAEWSYMHYKCRVTYKGEQHYYEACPLTETGEIDKISYIDLTDTAKLKPLQ